MLGGRLEERLESGRDSALRTRGSSSDPDSSSDDGEGARRTGGNLSPNPIVRVGGGGSLPRGLRSTASEALSTGARVLICEGNRRAGRGGAEERTSKALSSCVPRRDGSGGATGRVGVVVAELIKEDPWGPDGADKSFGRRGGRGGACRAGRGGGLGLVGGEKLSLELPECFRSR